MKSFFPQKLGRHAEIRRVEFLYSSLPSGVVAALIGTFLCVLLLFNTIEPEILKAWTVFMLSVLTGRIWVLYMFRRADRQSETIHRWEWLFAVGALLTGIGWGALFGPLFPSDNHPDVQMFIALMVIVAAFTGSVFLALSNITFLFFIVPTLGPAIGYYVFTLGQGAQWSVTAAAACVSIFIIVQRTLYRSTTNWLERGTEAEDLLAEQQAVFESSPSGIIVINGRNVLKCNPRFGELLGRRLQDILAMPLDGQFASNAEAVKFLAEKKRAFAKGQIAHGMYRLRRATGSEFWAEFSGKKMAGENANSVWMISDVTLRVANERRETPRASQ